MLFLHTQKKVEVPEFIFNDITSRVTAGQKKPGILLVMENQEKVRDFGKPCKSELNYIGGARKNCQE